MGAHGTLEEALANIASFATASQAKDSSSKHSSSRSSKHKTQKKHKKSKDKSKDKKGSHKKHKKKVQESSTEDSSSDEGQQPDLSTQLARGREAVRITRRILSEYPDMRADLRELLGRIDSGAGLAIDQLPIKNLHSLLVSLFDNLQLKKTRQGVYTKPAHIGSLLVFLSPVFDETQAELATVATEPHQADTPSVEPADESQSEPVQHATAATAERSGLIGPCMPQHASSPSALGDDNDTFAAGPQGPSAADSNGQQPANSSRPAAIGPAVPPPELLAAAAQIPWEEDEEDVEDLIGPAPPEMAEELDGVGGDERIAEVARVISHHLKGSKQKQQVQKLAETDHRIRLLSVVASGKEADAYEVLGVEPTATSGEIKKQYWRLSLLIHPDKCAHPRANDAFQAVSKVSKDLQDASKRSTIDAAREDTRLFQIASELADEEERKRQWRVAKGEATAEDLAGPVRRGAQPRDSWMTDLPPERVPTTLAPQGNQNTFSQKGIRSRGDTSDWTMTPAQRLLQLQGGSQQALAAGPSWEQDPRKAAQTAAAVDAYLGANRKKTLVEQHNEKKLKKRKAKEVESGASGQGSKEGAWEGKHPWRPFDREKDLNIASRPVTQEELLKKAGSLTGRFGDTTSGQRTFL